MASSQITLPRTGRRTQAVLKKLHAYESQNVTYLDPTGGWPIVWNRAKGTQVWDVEGRRYLDLTAAFGVAAAGHTNPRVVKAGQKQMATLLHAMGDVHPHPLKAELARALSKITFERWAGKQRAKTIFCNSGFEAVEAALKTAVLATGKRSLIAFTGAYHGLGYGTLNATHRAHFRSPFRQQLREFATFVPFPANGQLAATKRALEAVFGEGGIGAVLVEPMQARGGIHVPPKSFLPLLKRLCKQHGALLILDEIYTGFGRTGKWFACEHSETVPDLICLGKAVTGGFPLSACVGRADLMDAAWPVSTGEAIHTSTFLGHPVGCAMALAQMEELRHFKLVNRSKYLGAAFLHQLQNIVLPASLRGHARGAGLMLGLELTDAQGQPATATSLAVIKDLLHEGYILLPEGEHANVISFTPPLTITEAEITRTVKALERSLHRIAS